MSVTVKLDLKKEGRTFFLTAAKVFVYIIIVLVKVFLLIGLKNCPHFLELLGTVQCLINFLLFVDIKKLMERVLCCSCGKQINPMNPGAIRKHPWLKVVTCKVQVFDKDITGDIEFLEFTFSPDTNVVSFHLPEYPQKFVVRDTEDLAYFVNYYILAQLKSCEIMF